MGTFALLSYRIRWCRITCVGVQTGVPYCIACQPYPSRWIPGASGGGALERESLSLDVPWLLRVNRSTPNPRKGVHLGFTLARSFGVTTHLAKVLVDLSVGLLPLLARAVTSGIVTIRGNRTRPLGAGAEQLTTKVGNDRTNSVFRRIPYRFVPFRSLSLRFDPRGRSDPIGTSGPFRSDH